MQSFFHCDFGVNPKRWEFSIGGELLVGGIFIQIFFHFLCSFPIHSSLKSLCLNLGGGGGLGRVQGKPLLLTERAAVHGAHTVT